ncbi:outer membrane beta-barrel protein [Helicobacter pylori]|uniref:outer membrane beta-barrel protein n=1 Tax=Helicobacter pylori TaxID=210 RepID=UPI00287B9BD8|nr:outer membrane beta-barrel protein [Helicobacter pylori]WNE33196.1 outer membrane beta-barrel protein [Helicobacter pylori]WNE34624.1 outer membrane beta-barrel protein [Helicobacter pylori]WNE36049.1 outer membrane beta-barrel protein [Helicobacter pylori]WNE37477.1 outer membrane beta-barrel protein [Helicobacter pylori]WNE38903.1 outer membrane beta-barrel protein [Helicobacter pylori]
MLNHKENHEKSSLTLSLSLSFWLHAERNGFYLGSDILGGSYVQATGNINEFLPSNILYPQNYPSSPSPSNSNNPYAQYYPPTSSFPSNSNTVSYPGGTGGLFSEISFGYKYFLGKKRIIGFRHSLFFGYQVGSLGGLIAFLPYGFDTDLLINLWKNDDLDKRHSSTDYIIKRSSGFVVGVNIGASTWLSPATTIFQFQGKFGVRWNRDKYNAGRYLGGSSIELGVKVPAFGVYPIFRRWVSVYFNYTYNFKNN